MLHGNLYATPTFRVNQHGQELDRKLQEVLQCWCYRVCFQDLIGYHRPEETNEKETVLPLRPGKFKIYCIVSGSTIPLVQTIGIKYYELLEFQNLIALKVK